MLISENWLREWANPNISTQVLADTLTMAGLEVGNFDTQKAHQKIVVAEILSVQAHPKSDKLKLCKVAYSKTRSKTKAVDVVCGANNVCVGMKVPLAMIGAKLPNGMQVTKTKICDVDSSGMLCSAMELGLAEKSDSIMQLEQAAKVGDSLNAHLNLIDQIIELELTPNRGDCLSIAGVAREVSALTGSKLNKPIIKPVAALSKKRIPVKVEYFSGCPRYVARIIEGINPQSVTPDWMKEKLRRCGMRPISSVVDITNYVMLELGQPMHAFDMNNINTGIIVRNASKGEKLILLDDKQLNLKQDDLLICDHSGPIALAGIMGGLRSGINDLTQSVLLESAYFSQAEIIGKARRISMQTDASYRFERGVDPNLQELAIQRATGLMLDICGGKPGPVIEAVNKKYLPAKSSVHVRFSQINKVIGIDISPANVEKYLFRLGCKVIRLKNTVKATPPSYRFDLEKEHDLIEEVARLFGYNNIPENNPAASVNSSSQSESSINLSRFRNLMIDRGYHETITYSFVDPALQKNFYVSDVPIQLKNPIASNLSELRLSLIPGLLQALANNYHRQHRQIQLIEIGNIYYLDKIHRVEQCCLGGISTGLQQHEQWGSRSTPIDFYDIKSDVEAICSLNKQPDNITYQTTLLNGFHPGRCAIIYFGKTRIGFIGQILPSIAADLDIDQGVYLFQLNLNILTQSCIPTYESTSRFPSIRRDLSVLVDHSVTAADLLDEAKHSAGENLKELKLFDVYTGKPIDSFKKSVSIGLTFQALDRTLTELEMDDACNCVLTNLKNKFNAKLRV